MRSTLIITSILLLAGIPQSLVSQQVQATNWADSTLLPLLILDTYGQEIPDEPRITAHMGLIYNDRGLYNTPDDPYTAYDGQISIDDQITTGQSHVVVGEHPGAVDDDVAIEHHREDDVVDPHSQEAG